MFSGITRQEQKIFLILLCIIVVGVGVHQCNGRGRSAIGLMTAPPGSSAIQKSGANSPATPPAAKEPGLVNINTATMDDLCELKGIGPVKAQSIVDYRTEKGEYKSVDDLRRVKGIGKATLEDIRGQITVGEVSDRKDDIKTSGTIAAVVAPPLRKEPEQKRRININTADAKELMDLKHIGEVKAQSIIEYRDKNGPFRSPEGLKNVEGIGEKVFQANREFISISD